jgi:solute carrier family 25 carnitine/acylcarnitine transporter 20/29
MATSSSAASANPPLPPSPHNPLSLPAEAAALLLHAPVSPSAVAGRSEWVSIGQDLFAGTLGACAGIVVGQPLDTIKTRMQTSSGALGLSALSCIRHTLRVEGPRAFFNGLTSPLLANAPINAIVFGARGNMARLLDEAFPRSAADLDSGRPSYWRGAIAACWAGSTQCLVCVPADLVKCKLQVQSTPLKHPSTLAAAASVLTPLSSSSAATAPTAAPAPVYKGTWDCIRQIYRSKGVVGLYAGWWVTFWRDMPAYAAWFLAYDWTRTALQSDADLRARKPVSEWVTITAGSVAGIATWVSTYPFDVIKSVIQTAPPSTPKHELKIMYVARENYRTQGARFFFKGLTPTLLRAVPVSAVTFLVYEACMDFFGR